MRLRGYFRELRRYPSAVAGMVILAAFFVASLIIVTVIPYDEAIVRWREGSELFAENPDRAAPVYTDWFTSDRLPRTFVITLEDEGVEVTREALGDGSERVSIVLPFDYQYDGFPKELQLYHNWAYPSGQLPVVSVTWKRPDGEVISLHPDRDNLARVSFPVFYVSQYAPLERMLGEIAYPGRINPSLRPERGLFAVDITALGRDEPLQPLKGQYEVVMQAVVQEGVELNEVRLRVYGQVHGWAGTDRNRRDIGVALLWGAPIGLAFGILAAIGAQLSTFVLAGIGTWFGGKLDATFHKLTELTMILPNLAILIMIGHFYDPTIWRVLGIVIVLNVFSASLKVYRAIILQVKELPYIEAAQAYGAGSFRIIFRYLLPRMAPMLLPQFVIVVPSFVFLEASLAVLGLGDPMLPTWGKLVQDAHSNQALLQGQYYWIVQPAILLMLIGFGFAMVGYSLDRVVNPRLRTL